MRRDLVDLLLCPRCGGDSLRLHARHVTPIQYGSVTIDEIEDGDLACPCGVVLPIQRYVLSYEALLSPAARDAARHWASLYRLAWDHGVKGDFDLSLPVAPLLWWGILET